MQPFDERPWGFTAVFDKKNGGGFLDEHYPQAAKGSDPHPLIHFPPEKATVADTRT